MAAVFISYSHKDEDWKDRLVRHLKALGRQGLAIEAWQDREIPGGGDWKAEIQHAMAVADAAVLLVSTDFLASEFINEVEVPYLLGRREKEGLPVLPAIVEPCNWQLVDWLKAMNLRPKDGVALAKFGEPEIEEHLAAIAAEILCLVGAERVADSPAADPTRADWHLVHPYPMPPHFSGRVAERAMLSEWLEGYAEPLLALRALGGFGKSALVWHWLLNDVAPSQWPSVVWWSFYDESSFDAFLGGVLPYLKIDPKDLGPRDRQKALVAALRKRKILLVLDGFERALRAFSGMGAAYQGDEEKTAPGENDRDCVSPQVEDFLREISSLPGIRGRTLLTTRLRPRVLETRVGELLAACREVELLEMSSEDAVAFFRAESIRGTHAEIEAACRPYGFHPLSLRLLAGLIINDLRQPRDIAVAGRLDVSGDLMQRQHHVLEQSYKILPVEERKLLSRIACFRGAVSYEALSVAGQEMKTRVLEGALKDLVERGLLHREEREGRFDLHPIVRRYAYDSLGGEERKEAHRGLRDYFSAVPAPDKVETLADLAPVIELYHHMVRAGEYDAAFNLFWERLERPTYHQLGTYELRIELLRALFPDGEERPPRLREEGAQSWALLAIANSYARSGWPGRAVPLTERANEIDNQRGDKTNLALGLGNLAMKQLPIGELRNAESNLRRCIDLAVEIGDEYKVAVGHRDLGAMYAYSGRWDGAKAELDQALAILESMARAQSQGILWAYRALLLLMERRANANKRSASTSIATGLALAAGRRSIELAEERALMGHPNERDRVRANWLVGAACRDTQDHVAAEHYLNEALTRCRRINLIEPEADILIDLARLRVITGEPGEAHRLAGEAIAITERCGYVLQGADAHLVLSRLDLSEGKKHAALEHAREARRLARCDGPPDYIYKVAWDEAGALLSELGVKVVEES